jgi:hypothetical protein
MYLLHVKKTISAYKESLGCYYIRHIIIVGEEHSEEKKNGSK